MLHHSGKLAFITLQNGFHSNETGHLREGRDFEQRSTVLTSILLILHLPTSILLILTLLLLTSVLLILYLVVSILLILYILMSILLILYILMSILLILYLVVSILLYFLVPLKAEGHSFMNLLLWPTDG